MVSTSTHFFNHSENFKSKKSVKQLLHTLGELPVTIIGVTITNFKPILNKLL